MLIILHLDQGSTDTGYSTAIWTVPIGIADGSYELAIAVGCVASVSKALPGVDSYVSSPIRLVIDRHPPVKYGQGVHPSNGFYLPGDEVSVTFNEPVSTYF